VGILSSEEPICHTTRRLVRLAPEMVYAMHSSCIDGSMFLKYTDAISSKKSLHMAVKAIGTRVGNN
jgi:hypothetical protein